MSVLKIGMSYKEKIILEIRHCKTAVGNRKPKILQWEVSQSGQASDSNADWCFTVKLGSQLYGYEDWAKWSVEERRVYINILELKILIGIMMF